ncbi:hypothetical protein GLOTRDRAFT_45684 [Gloeophyllum trabeum ATCC 11539]|uniref:AB hydrolase-1 domain-containing protein n=1 Tax=Gloeophyllum trabeum (strain ATCC 11539 / FP-39264 / Madison 617) TaxID=670483 RepID=S7Q0F1_GLOTA|nr:uncharacterized protein GLOTRDRAFT_45684 [Gloeophyllum trabeum ATCC 11539]EPQ53391.1 hypothetical protein GLOTRDRAFT_45684 [Gloeophyllum trabeum ATCC 11539]
MDQSSYKDAVTTRGIKYHYYFSPPKDSKPILLFLHGFPSTSWDWRHIVPFFKERGYGVIVPDMLGYGGTDKPTDPQQYKLSLIAKDLVDILDAEKVEKVISVSHDWGSMAASRLANFYPERVLAFAFFNVPYGPPNPMTAEQRNEHFSKLAGYERFGYWFFMASPGADKLIEEKWDSFRSLYLPVNPIWWKEYLNPSGGVKAWLDANRIEPLPSYITEEVSRLTSYIIPLVDRVRVQEINHHRDILLKGGLAGPVCWYRVLVEGITPEDDKSKATSLLCYDSLRLLMISIFSCPAGEHQGEAARVLRRRDEGLRLSRRAERGVTRANLSWTEDGKGVRRGPLGDLLAREGGEQGLVGVDRKSILVIQRFIARVA